MKKTSLMILIVVLLQIFFPIFEIIDNNIFTSISKAETDYSSIDLDTLEEIKDNPEALSQVNNINVASNNISENQKILQQLDLVRLCSNVEYIYIAAKGLNLNKNFLNSINSSKEVSLSLQFVSIDFQEIENLSVTTVYLTACKIYHFTHIKYLSNLKWLSIETSKGIEIDELENLENLENLTLKGQRISNYQTLLNKVKNIKILNLQDSNLQNSDIDYIKQLTKLEELSLYGTYVTDISFLKELHNLKHINLPLKVDSLTVLYELPNLESVDFDAVTETMIDSNLINYFDNNNINYPKDFDREISSKINQIIDSFHLSENTTNEEKIRMVTEYVVKNMTYSSDTPDKLITSLDKTINYGYGVCHDYTTIEYTLLTLVGIEAFRVGGWSCTDSTIETVGRFTCLEYGKIKWQILWFGCNLVMARWRSNC